MIKMKDIIRRFLFGTPISGEPMGRGCIRSTVYPSNTLGYNEWQLFFRRQIK